MSFTYTPNIHLTRSRSRNELVLEQGQTQAIPKKTRVLVLGGGVTGLTSAWALLDAGFQVTIIADKWAVPEDTLGSALWEWPVGIDAKVPTLEQAKDWTLTSYRIFDKLAQYLPLRENGKPLDHGVRVGTVKYLFDQQLEAMDEDEQLHRWYELKGLYPQVQNVKRYPSLIPQTQTTEIADAFQHTTAMIDTDAYMRWLTVVVASKGGQFRTRTAQGNMLYQLDGLLMAHKAQLVVNTVPNVQSGEETATIRVANDGTIFPKVTEAFVLAHEGSSRDEDVSVVPRSDGSLILRGLVQLELDDYTLNLHFENADATRIRKACAALVPGLDKAPFTTETKVVDTTAPRLEKEGARLIHAYGGGEWSASFGCAQDVLGLVEDAEKGLPPAVEAGIVQAQAYM